MISYLDEKLLIQTCRNDEGSYITPSVVDLSDVNPMVGQYAKDTKMLFPHSVLDFFKSQMGRQHPIRYYNYDMSVYRETTAVDLSAKVLRYLANYASDETASKVSHAVITVPAYFRVAEKRATLEAAEKAGFEHVWLMEEPVAAAVYYGYKGNKKETVLVYDLGGATFDVSAVEIDGYYYDCFLCDGDIQLGGKDWDNCMQDIIKRKLMNAWEMDEIDLMFELDDEDNAEIALKAEEAKRELTSQMSTDIKFNLNAGRAQFEVTRQEFEVETKSLLDRTIAIIRSVKEKAEVKGKKITKILLVGGSSYMPQVQERLTAEFPDVEVPDPMDPNLVVSKGAAYYGKLRF